MLLEWIPRFSCKNVFSSSHQFMTKSGIVLHVTLKGSLSLNLVHSGSLWLFLWLFLALSGSHGMVPGLVVGWYNSYLSGLVFWCWPLCFLSESSSADFRSLTLIASTIGDQLQVRTAQGWIRNESGGFWCLPWEGGGLYILSEWKERWGFILVRSRHFINTIIAKMWGGLTDGNIFWWIQRGNVDFVACFSFVSSVAGNLQKTLQHFNECFQWINMMR